MSKENKIDENKHVVVVEFKNITSLRFIAAAFVILDHTEQARSLFELDNFWKVPGIYALGDKAVTLFFVLSGFLITFLLLKEKSNTGNISIKYFYVRRILRIWPLYYLIVILALFILPNFIFFQWPQWSEYLHDDFGKKCLLFLLILPNVNQVIFPAIPFGNQLWSIGVEEQFYLFWPLLLKFFKNTLFILLVIIIGLPVFVSALYYLSNHHLGISNKLLTAINFLKNFLSLTRIDCMAIGGVAAHILFTKQKTILEIVFHKYTQILNLCLLLFIFATGAYIPVINNIVHGVVFSILILNLAANPLSILNMENKYLKYLGSISFGVYMYHPLCIFLSIKFLKEISADLNNIFVWASLYLITFSLTIILAGLSFKFFELKFLQLKNKFSPVVSGVRG